MKVFVIGAGISGLFLSYYLLNDGHDVIVADVSKGKVRTSAYNAGQLSTRESFTDMFTRSKSVSVSAKIQRSEPRWFQLARRQTLQRYEKVARPLAMRSLGLYHEFLADEDVELDAYAEILDLHTKHPETDEKRPGRQISQREIAELGYKGFETGWRVQELSLHSGKLLDHLRTRCVEMGGEFVEGEGHLKRSGPVVSHARVNGEAIAADAYVVAAGSWARDVLRPLGYDPMVIPARGLVLFCETRGTRVIDLPSHYEDEGITATQHDDATLRLTSYFELAGFDGSFGREKTARLFDAATSHFSRPCRLKLAETGVGFRPSTPDQLPEVGKVPRVNNCFVLAGPCRKGMSLAPILAKLLIGCLAGDSGDEMLDRLDPGRFGDS